MRTFSANSPRWMTTARRPLNSSFFLDICTQWSWPSVKVVDCFECLLFASASKAYSCVQKLCLSAKQTKWLRTKSFLLFKNVVRQITVFCITNSLQNHFCVVLIDFAELQNRFCVVWIDFAALQNRFCVVWIDFAALLVMQNTVIFVYVLLFVRQNTVFFVCVLQFVWQNTVFFVYVLLFVMQRTVFCLTTFIFFNSTFCFLILWYAVSYSIDYIFRLQNIAW